MKDTLDIETGDSDRGGFLMEDVITETVTIMVQRRIKYTSGCRGYAIEDAKRLASSGESTTVGSGRFWSVEDEHLDE